MAREEREDTTYRIDLRAFVSLLIVTMIVSFGLGVTYGPPSSPLIGKTYLDQVVSSFVDKYFASSLEKGGYCPADSDGEGVCNAKENMSAADEPNPATRFRPRHPTEHVGDLGELIYPEDIAEEDEYQPAGQHLMLDLKNVSSEFLDSEERLSHAMVQVVKESELTLLSYHCHSLQPAGVTCVGVLLESHISFHTWPSEGVIILDLFTCGAKPLLPVVPLIQKLFGIPREATEDGKSEKVVTRWSHELRGFRKAGDRKNFYLDNQSDLAWWVISPLDIDYKKAIASVQSEYQRIDIWDTIDNEDTPSWDDIQELGLQPGDPRLYTNELAKPVRYLFLDGTLQSMSSNEREYYEALVHPGMFVHNNPKKVAIIGGGEGAILREVLKHNTVETVDMVEIDSMMVEIAKVHLPAYHNCTDLIEVADSCFDDFRANILIESAVTYFEDATPGSFDVIIFNALDPEHHVGDDSSGSLYSEKFIEKVFESLSDDGVLVIQIGTAPTIHDPSPLHGVYATRERLFLTLEKFAGAMFVYEDAHCGFNEPHSFLVTCKSASCRKNWYDRPNAIDYQIFERTVKTHSKKPPLIHFDGATHTHYQYAPKAWETVYCRREPIPFECNYRGLDVKEKIFEYDSEDKERSSFDVSVEEDGQVRIIAKTFIPEGSYVLATHLASSYDGEDKTLSNLKEKSEKAGDSKAIDDFISYVQKNGHATTVEGLDEIILELGISFLIRQVDKEIDANVGRMIPIPEGGYPAYSPVYERYKRSFDVFMVARKDIQEGEELLKHASTRTTTS